MGEYHEEYSRVEPHRSCYELSACRLPHRCHHWPHCPSYSCLLVEGSHFQRTLPPKSEAWIFIFGDSRAKPAGQ
ncbi:Uncharacterized protein HZ326_28407 [Fusarium oxysporum f. sp. albedinis]|nr:Uncharacterized protein HZ326_28407 [Fusarium oxysporum f. sp. albedinis]